MPLVVCLSLCEFKWGSAKTIFSCWTWLFSLLSLFCNFFSFCIRISEENESDIWNKIALINESNDGKWLAVFQSPLPNIKQVITSYEYEKCEKFHVGFKITVFYFYLPRMPQVLGRSPAASSGPRSPNRPIAYFYEESVLWKYIKYIILSLLFFLYQRREWKWYMK